MKRNAPALIIPDPYQPLPKTEESKVTLDNKVLRLLSKLRNLSMIFTLTLTTGTIKNRSGV